MKIRTHIETIRQRAKAKGRYRINAEKIGVSDSWLAKFAQGKVPNPTVDSIEKLETYFLDENTHAS